MSNFSILNYLQDFIENIKGGDQNGGAAEEDEFNSVILPLINADNNFKTLLEHFYKGPIENSKDLLTLELKDNHKIRTLFIKHQVRIVQKMLERVQSSDGTRPNANAFSGGGISFAGGYAGDYNGGMVGGDLTLGDQAGLKSFGPAVGVAATIAPTVVIDATPTPTPTLLQIIKGYIQYQTGEDKITDKILTDLTDADIGVFDVEFPKILKSEINETYVVDLCEILVEKYNNISVQSVKTNIVNLRESIIDNLYKK